MTYRPPFVSEKFHDTTYADCVWTSGTMLLGSWSFGDLLENDDHEPLSKDGLDVLREALRPGGPNATTGSNAQDFIAAVYKRWPDLPHTIQSYDTTGLRLDFPTFKQKILNGWVAMVAGNPANVNGASPLKRFVTNSVGHEIFIAEGGADNAFVMDPMGPTDGSYSGQLVPWADVQQFSQSVPTFNPDYIMCAIALRGEVSALSELSDTQATLKDTRAKNGSLIAANAALTASNATLQAQVTAAGTCPVDLTSCQSQVADLTSQLATANTALSTAQAAATACSTDLATANASLATCQTDLAASQELAQTDGDSIAALEAQVTTLSGANASLLSDNQKLATQLTNCQQANSVLSRLLFNIKKLLGLAGKT